MMLLHLKNTPNELIPFDKINIEDFMPSLKSAITQSINQINQINQLSIHPDKPNFINTIEALEHCGEEVELISNLFFNLNSANTSDRMQDIAKEFSALLSDYGNDILFNKALFKKIKQVYNETNQTSLSPEQQMLLNNTYKKFIKNGAKLNEDEQNKLRILDKALSKATISFEDNVLAETNHFELELTSITELEGLPQYCIDAAKQCAEEKNKPHLWVFTLEPPSYIPFITYSNHRHLREKIYKAYTSRGFQKNAHNNQQLILDIIKLRSQRAQLLGYASYAHLILEERMVESVDNANQFLHNLLSAALPFAKQEKVNLEQFSQQLDNLKTLEKWDVPYYSQKLKNKLFSIDNEKLKPYFALDKVIEGVFETAQKLFDLDFVKLNNISVYHKDVVVYEVLNKNKQHQGILYMDFFPRPNKRQGAWMTNYKQQHIVNQINNRPHVSIVCNFSKPLPNAPSLLTFEEVTTLFHEFGHALHSLCSNVTYQSLAGTNVFWDFVELPSQILENWCYEKECLQLFAKHYQTNEALPLEYIENIKKVANFQSGLFTLRQLGFGLLDLMYHDENVNLILSVKDVEQKIAKLIDLWPPVLSSSISCAFSHIFSGGYSAGYYSYKWAEAIEADAYELFKEQGIFNKPIADKFKSTILSKGGTEHPTKLFYQFRERALDTKTLLKKSGFVTA